MLYYCYIVLDSPPLSVPGRQLQGPAVRLGPPPAAVALLHGLEDAGRLAGRVEIGLGLDIHK